MALKILHQRLPNERNRRKEARNSIQPIRSTNQNQIWVVTQLQYEIFCARSSDVIARGNRSGGVSKCRLFSQPNIRTYHRAMHSEMVLNTG